MATRPWLADKMLATLRLINGLVTEAVPLQTHTRDAKSLEDGGRNYDDFDANFHSSCYG